MSSPKTICIDHCGYNFHFSIKVGRGGHYQNLHVGQLYLGGGNHGVSGRVSGSELNYKSSGQLINLSLQ